MSTDAFGALVPELGKYLNLPDLEADEKNTCAINFGKKDVQVLLTVDEENTHLKIYCRLGEVAGGRYREEVLHELLRANELPYPRYGNFGFNFADNSANLWDKMPLKDLKGADMAEYLEKFSAKAAEVKDALNSNTVPSLIARTTIRTGGLFGLR